MAPLLETDVVIIGDGIAGFSLAYQATKHNLRSVVLGKGLSGATAAATGFLSPRPDYLLEDFDLVERTAVECLRWRQIFGPEIIKPKSFILPFGPDIPQSPEKFEVLMELYDKSTALRLDGLPGGHSKINTATLERMEPNLRKNYFDGGLLFWEWMVDPQLLLKKMANEAIIYSSANSEVLVREFKSFEIQNGIITEIMVKDIFGNRVRIGNTRGPIIVVNCCGAWLPDIWKILGVASSLKLKLGVQAQVLGCYLGSGVITFAEDGKYVVCLQENGYVQIGPTNTNFDYHPDSLKIDPRDIEYLSRIFGNIMDIKTPKAEFLKSGFRVMPFVTDTNRPVIWSHDQDGLSNFYSLHPGKMVLALLAADELLAKARKDGWFCVNQMSTKNYALDGYKKYLGELKTRWWKLKSFTKVVLYYLQYLTKQKPR